MTILELIQKSAVILNVEQIVNDKELKFVDSNTQDEVLDKNFPLKRMFEFAKIVINEVASYAPKVYETKYKTTNKKIRLSSIVNLAKIIAIKYQGNDVKYTSDNINLEFEHDGEYTIVYTYYPSVSDLNDHIVKNNDKIDDDIYIYGLNAYYCLAIGLVEEFNVYHAHYTKRLANIKNLKIFAMPCRSWNG